MSNLKGAVVMAAIGANMRGDSSVSLPNETCGLRDLSKEILSDSESENGGGVRSMTEM